MRRSDLPWLLYPFHSVPIRRDAIALINKSINNPWRIRSAEFITHICTHQFNLTAFNIKSCFFSKFLYLLLILSKSMIDDATSLLCIENVI
jgi:hypothetical protein